MQKPTIIVLDDSAWGKLALERIAAIRAVHPNLIVAVSPENRFLQTCDLWSEHAWYEPDRNGWGIRILGALAMDFALLDARETTARVREAVWAFTDAAVVSTTLGANPAVVVSGPRYAEQAIWTGRAGEVFYLCAPSREADRKSALGGIPNAHLIHVEAVAPTPLPAAA